MIIRSLLRRPGAFRSSIATPTQRIFSPLPARFLHGRPTLSDHERLQKDGIKGLYSPKGFKIAFEQYQELIVEQLNAVTARTTLENAPPRELTIQFARDPAKAYEFNLASMAFNNHFFFEGLATNPDIQSQPTSELLAMIRQSFSSFDGLREEMITTADAMFGPGFVWLVQVRDKQESQLRILTTYLAGSPLSGAHYRKQSTDLNTHNVESYQQLNPVGKFGKAAQYKSSEPKKPLGGVDVTPLLCVNTWEHAWLPDHGIGGKFDYLVAWWDKINWDIVQSKATFSAPKSKNYDYQT